MSRILKRPMFRSGGSVDTNKNNGIMTGLVDRKGYGIGGIDREKLKADTQTISDLLAEFAPISKTRVPYGQFGLNIASGMSITDALKDPYKQFTTADDARRALLAKREQGALSTALAGQLKEPKVPTTKAVRNISKETLFGIPPGQEGLATNKQILSVQGKLKATDTRMITLPDGKGGFSVMPYEEYKIQNTQQNKAKAVGTEFNILNGLVDRMTAKLPTTKTGALGYGFEVVEGFADQIAQVAESFGVKENWKEDDYDERAIDTYLAKKGFSGSLEEGAAASAIMKGAVINLAYALARIAEPGNPRLSEGDIMRQLDRIKYGGSRNTFAKSLAELLEQEKIRASRTIEGFNLNPEDYLGISKKDATETGKKTIRGKVIEDPAGIRAN